METTRRRAPAVLLAAAAGIALAGAARAEVADGELAALVDRRVQGWEPSKAERRFDEVGWCTDIRAAERLAKRHNRPVFLFTHDGRMAIGRC